MPFEESHDLPEFKQWLVTTLEPMCDADPVVMSDYIIALLKHEAQMTDEDWRLFISRELADFLEEKSLPFVNLLFETLQTKSFMPAAAAPAPAINPAGTTAAHSIAPVSSFRPPPTGPSSSTPFTPPQQAEAGPSTVRAPSAGQEGMEVDVEMGEDGKPGPPAQKRGKKPCYDYHNRGFCLRGVNCPYDHSDDAIIPNPEQMFQNFNAMQQGFRGRGGGPVRGRGRGRGGAGGGMPMNGTGHPNGFPNPFGMPFPMPFPFAMPPPPANDPASAFWGSNRPPQDRTSTTLVVTDIPREHLTMNAIREFFGQFGEITNVAIEGKSARALVSFTSNAEAYKAWRSDAPVFNSRHVKVLWHRPRPGQGGEGQQALDASAGLIANMKALEESGASPQQGKQAILQGPNSRLKATLADLEAKERRQRKETLMAEQKVLLKRAEGAASKAEKLELLKRMRELQKELEEVDKPKDEAGDVSMGLSEKERLDKELATHGMETAQGKDDEELLKLQAQLSALRDKANTLGINSSARYSPYSRPAPSRGRGRGAPRGRGRGGFARPMALDNRSRVLSVTAETPSSEAAEKLKEWYESTGGHVVPSENGSLIVRYPNREMAERALAMGTKEVDVPVKAGWHSEVPTNGHATPTQEVDMEAGPTGGMLEESSRGGHDDEE